MKETELDKLERYIAGLSSDEEKTWVESQFLNEETNYTLRNLLINDWESMLSNTSTFEVDLNHILYRIHNIIRKNETLKRKKPLQKFIRIYIKAAAILLLPLLIAGGLIYRYLGNQTQSKIDQQVFSTIFAPMGARVSFTLPDGTIGMLNSGSNLSYSLPFTNNRHITLEGEAWFEVSRDKNDPFEISTGNSMVKVLGTSFNLSAYPEEKYVEVVLQKGSVEFLDNKSDEKVIMVPDERLIFQEGKISKSVTDPLKYILWTEGKLVFRGDPMEEVGRRIERWYNVKVVIADKELKKYSFRATFLDDTLEEVLNYLSLTSPIRYRINPRELMQDGTYKKEEITIFLK